MHSVLRLLLFLAVVCDGSSWHTLRYFSTMIWEPDQSTFIAVAYMDDQLGGHYNRSQKKTVPQVLWWKEMEKNHHDIVYWITKRIKNDEMRMKEELMNLQSFYNRSTGLHILQRMISCELNKDGGRRGFYQFAYNGEDYLSFDKETLTWTAAVGPALRMKRKYDADLTDKQDLKLFLEEICIGWLQEFLHYGKAFLLKTVTPTVTVARKAAYDDLETLICRAYGFYPKEIDATWRKDGEIWEQETFHGGVIPNSDGTYHTWLSITVHSKERKSYLCHVEHESLPEHLDLAWEEPANYLTPVCITVGAAIVVVVVITICCWRRRRGHYQAAGEAPAGDDHM